MTEKEFISTKNKAMIWQLLMEANAFINIPDSYFEKIKTIYEQIILEISNITNISLTDRNKMLMSKMMEKIKYFSNEHIQKPLQEVSIKVSEDFENKKQEFIQLVNHNKPTDISFSDNIDKPFNDSELNQKLSELMTDRSYDTLPPLPKPLENNDNNIVETNKDNQEKKVSFVPSTENIISKLKTIDSNNKSTDDNKDVNIEILNILKTISINQQLTLKNQDKILELLLKQ
jgi:hypothetical protein